MNNKEFFSSVLQKEESIVEVFKPNRKRFVNLTIFRNAIASLVTLIFPAIFVLVFALSENSNKENTKMYYLIPGLIALLIVLGFVVSVIVRAVVYNKTYYCCTNKRIIIRRGFIKVNYQTLDYNLIKELNLQIDVFDKMMKPNTGTIIFVSKTSSSSDKEDTSYYFAHIEQPCENYEKIKEYSFLNLNKKTIN